MAALEREEYVEQAYLFQTLHDRLTDNRPLQELFEMCREELLATTKLPLAVDFMLSELRHHGTFSTAMRRLDHYFAPFQTYLVQESEDDRGRFDLQIALEILWREAEYRSEGINPQGLFLFQFEALCRNRLRYEAGLDAIAADPCYDEAWSRWIKIVRRQIGIVDFADLLYVRSEYYRWRHPREELDEDKPILFAEKEGKIAFANRRKDPLYLFAALQRHLGYPPVPRLKPQQQSTDILPQLMRRVEQLDARIKLLEEEQRSGIDITKFYEGPGRKRP